MRQQPKYFGSCDPLVTSMHRGLSGGCGVFQILHHRSAVAHGSLPCSCPMWICCQDCSVPARTGVVSGTSATHLTVREKDEKSGNIAPLSQSLPSVSSAASGLWILTIHSECWSKRSVSSGTTEESKIFEKKNYGGDFLRFIKDVPVDCQRYKQSGEITALRNHPCFKCQKVKKPEFTLACIKRSWRLIEHCYLKQLWHEIHKKCLSWNNI